MKKILIVDDRADLRQLVQATLSVGEFEFLQAESGERALELARRERPDLVIMDVMMPGQMDGYEVCQALKQDPDTRPIAVLMLTAKSQEADLRRGRQAGADDYFVKPFSPRNLLEKIHAVLQL